MRLVAYILGVMLLVILETSFFGQFRIFGVIPNLLLIAIILNGLHGTASSTVAMALGGGLLLDLASGQDFGLRLAFFTLVAMAVIVIRQLGFQLDGLWMVGLLAAAGTVAFNMAIMAGIGWLDVRQHFDATFRLVGMELIINCAFIAAVQVVLSILGMGDNRGEPGLRKRTILQWRG